VEQKHRLPEQFFAFGGKQCRGCANAKAVAALTPAKKQGI
jgi:hypothetical protein